MISAVNSPVPCLWNWPPTIGMKRGALVNMNEAQWMATIALPPSTKSTSACSCSGVIVSWLA